MREEADQCQLRPARAKLFLVDEFCDVEGGWAGDKEATAG